MVQTFNIVITFAKKFQKFCLWVLIFLNLPWNEKMVVAKSTRPKFNKCLKSLSIILPLSKYFLVFFFFFFFIFKCLFFYWRLNEADHLRCEVLNSFAYSFCEKNKVRCQLTLQKHFFSKPLSTLKEKLNLKNRQQYPTGYI